ncbi:MAG: hypothetical protein NT027_08485 [Proteobacteria bacterium]|nr:hypothetical protein [Pseudomonadota bacterium]
MKNCESSYPGKLSAFCFISFLLVLVSVSTIGISSVEEDLSFQKETSLRPHEDDGSASTAKGELDGNSTEEDLTMFIAGRCRGIARSCSSINSRISCNSQDGCRWSNNDCKGNARTCMLVRTESKCKSIRGCRWSD